MVNLSDIRKKTDSELMELLDLKKQALWKFKLGATGGKTRNVKEGRELRREVAQILTVLSERKQNSK